MSNNKKIKIAHISDIHIRSLTRHNEFKIVLNAFIDDVKKNNVDFIFVAGDIWHAKTQSISPEFIDFFNDVFTRMAEVAPVHMILGNHDGALTNTSRQDAISPIVAALNNPKIFLYKKSGTYNFAPGMNWNVFSIFDEEGWDKVKPIENEYNIASYHGCVKGAKTEADWELTDGLSVDFFKDYDLCLLGDIHKLQFLDYREYVNGKKPWIGYSGSSAQQNFAEDLVHGYLLWEINLVNKTHEVEFKELPNPNPFITIDWQGNVQKTLIEALKYSKNARYRIKSTISITQKDVSNLTSELKRQFGALETTFKIDETINRDIISTGTMSIVKDDLRNTDIIMKMMKEYYKSEDIDEKQWEKINNLVEKYMKLASTGEEINRNSKWTIKELEFDNLYAYGEKNYINFEKLSGITGIFGPNRTGKSSLVGAILYNLFNTSDRGSLKNIDLINERKNYALTKSKVNVNGIDYLFERQTVKMENKKGPFGITSLNAFKVNNDGTKQDLNGEQRNDTDKLIRNLIGNVDDFMITGVSTQDDMKKFIKEGSTVRRQVISRFLDLDFFERVHVIIKQDVNNTKTLLKNLLIQDWDSNLEKKNLDIDNQDQLLKSYEQKIIEKRQSLQDFQLKLSSYKKVEPTTKDDVEKSKKILESLKRKQIDLKNSFEQITNELIERNEKLEKLEVIKNQLKIDELSDRLVAQRDLERSLSKLQHQFEKESDTLNRKEKSILKLLEVPCGDSFPTCKFIKDSYQDKLMIDEYRLNVETALQELKIVDESFELIKKENIIERIKKGEQVNKYISVHQTEISKKNLEIVKIERDQSDIEVTIKTAQDRYESLQDAHENSENLEMVNTQQEITNISRVIQGLEKQKLMTAQQKGKLESDIEKIVDEKQRYENLSEEFKIYELISNAFSKKGIPNKIIHSQLPLINREINNILAGIINFTVEFEADVESNSLDIYVNYGDSRRMIELCSGMEKMITALAIRVALSIITTLPKTDMMIIDEGFSDLDETQIETCNKMIKSMTKYFKNILLITHLDGIKDVVDNRIEIIRNEHDSKIWCE